jgi:PHD/YefM family antitoxin component YafN of YafNO toxin-antitoxin module
MPVIEPSLTAEMTTMTPEEAASELKRGVRVTRALVLDQVTHEERAVLLSPEEYRALTAFGRLAGDSQRQASYRARIDKIERGETLGFEQFFSGR